MALKIVLFEDNQRNANELLAAITSELSNKGVVKLFEPLQTGPKKGTFEDRLENDLQQTAYNDLSLIVADRDLSLTKDYVGLSESPVKRVADKLHIPECAYSRGERADDFLTLADQREARIALSLSEGPEKFARQAVAIAEDFEFIKAKIQSMQQISEKKRSRSSPGQLLASMLGKPDYADKIGLYASGDQNRLAMILATKKEERLRSVAILLGYWLWDSVLRYPGVVVNEVAASSYLNIKEDVFKIDREVGAIFSSARYQGPFARAKEPLWWRSVLDDLIDSDNCKDGRELAEKKLRKTIPQSECCEDPRKSAGYYCIVKKKPVSLENSKGGLTWFPRGADLTRVSLEKYEELGPWL